MIVPFEEMLERIKAGEQPSAIVESLLLSEDRALLARCAVARLFDLDVVQKVLLPGTQEEAFARLVKGSSVVKRVGQDGYRMEDQARQRHLDSFKGAEGASALRDLSERLVGYYQQRRLADPAREALWTCESLYHLLRVDVGRARVAFETLFKEADEAFDLPRCHDLLAVLRAQAPLLGADLTRIYEDRTAYLEARSMWAEEYYRTARYQERQGPREALERLLSTSGKEDSRVLQLFAKGGIGKTIFLRWAIARRLVPARIPCARIDFDFTTREEVQTPWRLLLRLAAQLDRQVPGHPFRSLLLSESAVPGESERASSGEQTAYLDSLAQTVPDLFTRILKETAASSAVVLILDTMEEPLLHQTGALSAILAQLAAVVRNCESVRLILSGRYDLAARPEKLLAPFAPGVVTEEITAFSEAEARVYLTSTRAIPDAVVDVVTKRAEGIPFKLSLFADILKANPAMTREEILAYPSVELTYLIDRVVERIPEEAVKWLLRYGVIPRRLTWEFVSEVMAPHLRKGLEGRANEDDRAHGLPKEKENAFPINAAAALDLREEWKALTNYAGGAAWVSQANDVPDTLIFHGEVVNPMRALLATQTVFTSLHRDAIRHFERRAIADPPNATRWLSEVMYHRFQLGDSPEPHFRALMRAAAKMPERRRALATEVMGPEYVSEGKSLVRTDGNQRTTPIISDALLNEARFARALACAELAQGSTGLREAALRDEARAALLGVADLDAFDGEERVFARVAALRDADPEAAIALAREHLGTSHPRNPRLVLECAQLADRLSRGDVIGCYEDVLSSGLDEASLCIKVRLRLAQLLADKDVYDDAIRHCDAALKIIEDGVSGASDAAASAAPPVDAAAIEQALVFLADLYLRSGQPHSSLDSLSRPAWRQASWRDSLGVNVRREIARDRARLALDQPRDLPTPLERPPVAKLERSVAAERFEVDGDENAALFRFEDAAQLLNRAQHAWEEARSSEGVARCQEKLIKLRLEQMGDPQQTRVLLIRSERMAVSVEQRLTFDLLRLDATRRSWATPEALFDWAPSPELPPDQGSPRMRIRLLIAKLVPGVEPEATAPLVQSLISELGKVRPVSARLQLLDGIERVPAISALDPTLAEELVALLQLEQGSKDTEGHLAPLRKVEMYRVLGRSREAGDRVRRLASQFAVHRKPYVVRALLLTWDRAGFTAEDIARAEKLLEPFNTRYGGDPIGMAARIEHAERRQRLGRPIPLPTREQLKAGLDPALDTQWTRRLDALALSAGTDSNESRARAGVARREIPMPAATQAPASPAGMAAKAGAPMPQALAAAPSFSLDLASEPDNQLLQLLVVLKVSGKSLDIKRIVRGVPGVANIDESEQTSIGDLARHVLHKRRGEAFSHDLMMGWLNDWERAGRDLGETLFGRNLLDLKRRTPGLHIRIATDQPSLHAAPWELARDPETGELLLRAPWVSSFGRIADVARSTVPPPRLPKAHPRVVVVRSLLESSQGIRGATANVEHHYAAAGAHVEMRSPDDEALLSALAQAPLDVIHLSARFAEASASVGDVYLDFGIPDAARNAADAATTMQRMTPFDLSHVLGPLAIPIVVLDVPQPDGPTETMRQLFLRNAFGAELSQLMPRTAILAIGFGDDRSNLFIHEALATGLLRTDRPAHAVVSDIRRSMALDSASPMGAIASVGAALFGPS